MAMFGLIEWWNGIEWGGIESDSSVWFCKKVMEWNGVWWNSFHPIPLIHPSFHSSQIGVYSMEWNTLIIQLHFYPYFFYFISHSSFPVSSFHSLFLVYKSLYSSFLLQYHENWLQQLQMEKHIGFLFIKLFEPINT